MDWADKEQKKQYSKQWRKDNPEYGKQWRKDNPEYGKQWRKDNPEYGKQWRKDNPEYSKQHSKQWRKDNKEHSKKYFKQWYKDNPEYSNQRYATDFMYRLNKTIRGAIWRSLKTNTLSKNGRHWETLVGYTLQELKFHLETQFDSNMNWENHGSYWHIDHIIPLASLPFSSVEDENFRLLWSLGNLQPLFGPDNVSKNKKIVINFKSLLFPFTEQPVKDKC